MKDYFIKFRVRLVPKREQCKVKDALKIISSIPKIQKDPPPWLSEKYQQEKDLYFCHNSEWGRVKVLIETSQDHEIVSYVSILTLPWLPNEKLAENVIQIISHILTLHDFEIVLVHGAKKIELDELRKILLDEYNARSNSVGLTDQKSRDEHYQRSLKYFEEFE